MIKLKYFEKDDFRNLISWINSKELMFKWSGLTFKYPLTENQLNDYMVNANGEDSSKFIYKAICENNKVIGHISLLDVDRKNNSGKIGMVLIGDKETRSSGLGSEMVEAVLEIAFEKLNLHRVELVVFDFNKSAISCYERVGFLKEGLKRDCRKVDNKYYSLYTMSILENEWKQKSNFI